MNVIRPFYRLLLLVPRARPLMMTRCVLDKVCARQDNDDNNDDDDDDTNDKREDMKVPPSLLLSRCGDAVCS